MISAPEKSQVTQRDFDTMSETCILPGYNKVGVPNRHKVGGYKAMEHRSVDRGPTLNIDSSILHFTTA
jgi:hypothetical protein